MTVWVVYGWWRTGLLLSDADTTHLAALGVLQANCLECDGTGEWPYHPEFDPEKDTPPPCVVCKGTGRVYIGG